MDDMMIDHFSKLVNDFGFPIIRILELSGMDTIKTEFGSLILNATVKTVYTWLLLGSAAGGGRPADSGINHLPPLFTFSKMKSVEDDDDDD